MKPAFSAPWFAQSGRNIAGLDGRAERSLHQTLLGGFNEPGQPDPAPEGVKRIERTGDTIYTWNKLSRTCSRGFARRRRAPGLNDAGQKLRWRRVSRFSRLAWTRIEPTGAGEPKSPPPLIAAIIVSPPSPWRHFSPARSFADHHCGGRAGSRRRLLNSDFFIVKRQRRPPEVRCSMRWKSTMKTP